VSVPLALGMLAWLPFLNPVKLPRGAQLWMVLPLVLCVAVVYRATRARQVSEMPKATLITFVNIIVGMAAIAVAFYAVHHVVVWLL
jgi:NAD/NADP transhydrogenase beta subunit